MVSYVLDASAVMRFLDSETGAKRIEEILTLAAQNLCIVQISAVNWGEVVGSTARKHGLPAAETLSQDPRLARIQMIAVTGNRAAKSALVKVKFGIAYADCFGIELASDSPDHILVTADYGAKPAENDIHIEFLPTKQTP